MGDSPIFPLLGANLADTESDTAAVRLDTDDLNQDLLATRQFIALSDIAQLRIVQQTFHTRLQLDEDTEVHYLRHLALHKLADLVANGYTFPGIRRQHLDAQGDSLTLAINTQNLNLDTLTGAIDLTGILDPAPRKLGNMDQTVHPAEVHKQTEIGDLADASTTHLIRFQLRKESLAALNPPFFRCGAL